MGLFIAAFAPLLFLDGSWVRVSGLPSLPQVIKFISDSSLVGEGANGMRVGT